MLRQFYEGASNMDLPPAVNANERSASAALLLLLRMSQLPLRRRPGMKFAYSECD